MTVEDLRDLSDAFGAVLRQRLGELEKEADVRGGGLRHGEVEWQFSYLYEGMRRFLMFGIGEASHVLVSISAGAAASDDKGRWASAPAASTSLPKEFLRDQLDVIVPQLLDQARYVANSLGESDMRSMLISTMEASSG